MRPPQRVRHIQSDALIVDFQGSVEQIGCVAVELTATVAVDRSDSEGGSPQRQRLMDIAARLTYPNPHPYNLVSGSTDITMTAQQGQSATVHNQPQTPPKAIGFETSLMDSPRRRIAIQRHAEKRGYRYVYMVCPPEGHADPVGYALNIAIGIHAAAIIVYDLEVVGHSSARVCEQFDLETVCPEQTWSRVLPAMVDPEAHGLTEREMDPDEAHRIFQQHAACRASKCPRKQSAIQRLVEAGKLKPRTMTPQERAIARVIAIEPIVETEVVGEQARAMLDSLDELLDTLRGRAHQ
ncbi:hypothetical protein ACIBJI_23905 [Nocardia sp. NPDC050408]|uniref:hypothetical protein n=1 Tax=Nocardia sp. NPDC050408 TaxID=3364319 RepID=UPI0037B7C1B4